MGACLGASFLAVLALQDGARNSQSRQLREQKKVRVKRLSPNWVKTRYKKRCQLHVLQSTLMNDSVNNSGNEPPLPSLLENRVSSDSKLCTERVESFHATHLLRY